MKKLKNLLIIFFFIFTINCGYTPLINSENIDFNINKLSFEGDRKINNYILEDLRKYKKNKNKIKSYNIKISSNYEKKITNKDSSGNPKNYNLEVATIIEIITNGGGKIKKNFLRSMSLSAKSKKFREKELEEKNKKKLASLISEDIIFFLINN